MRICRRRRTGFLATGLLIWQLLDTVYGIPAYTSYAETWRSWVKVMGVSSTYVPLLWAGVFLSLAISTSDLWWPRVSRLLGRIRSTTEIPGEIVGSEDSALAKMFSDLAPLIIRHRKALRPVRSLFFVTVFDVTWRLGYVADREELVAHLDTLGVQYPPNDAERSIWFNYMVQLEAACQLGDLERAREIYN